MKVWLDTMGCRLNEAEMAAASRALHARGAVVVDAPADADTLVLNTCAVTTKAAKEARQYARRLKRENPEARLVLTGCAATLNPEAVVEADLVVANAHKDELAIQLVPEPTVPTEALFPRRSTRGFVKVQDGCRNRCSFCITTVARGNERSRHIADVVAEVQHLEDLGYREVVFSGVHLGGFGSDTKEALGDLLATILAKTSVPRIRLGSLEPWDIAPDFFGLWTDSRMCPHLHLPLQAGHDSTLRQMARRNTTAQFADLVAKARAVREDLTLTTDLIVGFPGETDADFEASCAFVRSMGFGDSHIFSFSPRPGTRAATLPGQVKRSEKRRRSAYLHSIRDIQRARWRQRFVGTIRPVLFEASSHSYTDNYLPIRIGGDTNQIASVLITSGPSDELSGTIEDRT